MTGNNQTGGQGRTGMNPQDQSLDRGYGGLPGKNASESADDKTVTKKPAKDKVRSDERRPEVTKH
jgi:hypothetical protein